MTPAALTRLYRRFYGWLVRVFSEPPAPPPIRYPFEEPKPKKIRMRRKVRIKGKP